MGTIADLLGGQFPQDWQPSEEAATDSAVAQAAEATPGEPDAKSADAVVMEIVLDETGFPPEQMRPDLRIVADLDLSGLALWSVVARVERELGTVFPDSEVEGWKTLGDLLAAAGR